MLIGFIAVVIAGIFVFPALIVSGWKMVGYAAGILVLLGLLCFKATSESWGADRFEEEEGVSLREGSSATGRRSFFVYYNQRSHMGGGLAGGK